MAYKGNQVLLGFVVLGGTSQGLLDIHVLTILGSLLDRRPCEFHFPQAAMNGAERSIGMVKDGRSDMGFQSNCQSLCSWSKMTFCDLVAIGNLGSH